jgi:polyhydroxybutyrate depolymerase
MKNCIVILLLIGLPIVCLAQQTIDYTITHDSLQREYILYVPASYTGNEPVPLLFNFHGMGGTATYQMEQEGDFRSIADTAGFLIAHPQGTLNGNVSFWNIGFDTTVVDDIGFTEAMIDSIGAEYTIDRDRVYSAGKSLGGFFSIHLAGQLSEKIAAIAPVAGTMTPDMYNNMSPVHPTPLLQIHGTDDFNVPYNGFPFPYLSVTEVLQYWVDYNNCNTTPIITQLPDIDTTDGSTVERHVYDGGDNGVNVEHLKVIGGMHTWPGSIAGDPGTNYDIDASEEIWAFLSRYDINGLIGGTTGIEPGNISQIPATFLLSQNYPNPFNPTTVISYSIPELSNVKLAVYDILGREVAILVNDQLSPGNYQVEFIADELSSGVYLYRLDAGNFTQINKMLLLK